MSTPGAPYLPSNSSEGECFFCEWCSHCARDKPMSEGKDFDACEPHEVRDILAASFRGNVAEWQHDKDGNPCCTAFAPAGQAIPMVDTRTLDLFA